MNMKSNKLKISHKIILSVLCVGMLNSTGAMAERSSGEHGSHGEKKLERLIRHLNLSQEQGEIAEQIIAQLKEAKQEAVAGKNSHQLMSLNPGDADYLEKVAEHAELKAAHIKSNLIQMAAAKQSLYEILDDEQKEKMSKMAERRMKKKEKKPCRHD